MQKSKTAKKKMRLPEIVKQIGNIAGESRIYIEDYVYTYLNEIKTQKNSFPVRVALYGHAYNKEQKQFHLIYGASCVIEELENGRNEEQIKEKYFEEYELIGYVNIYNEQKEIQKGKAGYYIFYESNEAMQNYMIHCYERKNKNHVQKTDGEQKQSLEGVKEGKYTWLKGLMHKLLYGILVVITVIAVITIDDYNKMYDFSQTAAWAIQAAENG